MYNKNRVGTDPDDPDAALQWLIRTDDPVLLKQARRDCGPDDHIKRQLFSRRLAEVSRGEKADLSAYVALRERLQKRRAAHLG